MNVTLAVPKSNTDIRPLEWEDILDGVVSNIHSDKDQTYVTVEIGDPEAGWRQLETQMRRVSNELLRATQMHGPMVSAHEGYAVILEEVRELEREVFVKRQSRSREIMRSEATQLAAMAIRFLIDVVEDDELWETN